MFKTKNFKSRLRERNEEENFKSNVLNFFLGLTLSQAFGEINHYLLMKRRLVKNLM
jgi:hypothetical protein